MVSADIPARPHDGNRHPAGSLIGRDEELEWMRAALQPGKASLVLGPKGIGKTALMRAARDLAVERGLGAAFTSRTSDMAGALADLASQIGAGPLSGSGRALLGRLLRRLSDLPTALLVDDADLACRGLARAIRRIALERAACLLVAARTGPREDTDRLRRIVFAGTNELHVRPLSPAAATSLAMLRLGDGDPRLAREIARASRGVPVAVVEMARRSGEARYRIRGKLSLALILADLRVENRA